MQFIWQYQYFNKRHLHTTAGEYVQVIQPGQFNHNQGPDFLDGRIRIDDTLLAGNIELHITEADWLKHAHQHDPNYRNVILHVLWEPPCRVQLPLPTICLKDRVSKILLERYQALLQSKSFVPCMSVLQSEGFRKLKKLTWVSWKERLLVERLLRKEVLVSHYLRQSNNHWEEVFWWMLARNFGITVNTEAFEAIARSLPLTLLARHRAQLPQLEALLLGQAGLLEKQFDEHYPRMLAGDFRFYSKKYGLRPVEQPVHFLRMRPRNFPSVRLAQLAVLLHHNASLFSIVRERNTVQELSALLQVTAGEYWDIHYRLDEPAAFNQKQIGNQMVDNIIINTVVPMLFAYGHVRQEPQFRQKAMDLLEQLSPEHNSITSGWQSIGIANQDAWDSQALIELKKEYCDKRRCLECAVGNGVLGGEVKS